MSTATPHADGGRDRGPHAAQLHRRTVRRGRHERAPGRDRARDRRAAGARAAVLGGRSRRCRARRAGGLPAAGAATPTIERARRMFTLRQALVENQERIARLITQDMGKTLPDAFAEVGRAIEMVECASAVPTTMQGRNLENVATNVDCETYRQPIGVFGAICPFNFPAMVPMWFLPFAVACGNTFVLKPSEQVPLAQEAIFKLIHDLELLPPGVINLVNGGREVVEGICDHPGIAGVSFVGSATVAKLVYERSARAGKRVQALGGAKNHMVVMPDAVVDKTVENIIGSVLRRGRPALHGGLRARHGRQRARARRAGADRGGREAARRQRPREGRRRRPARLERAPRHRALVDRQGRGRGRERRARRSRGERRQRRRRVRRPDDHGRRDARDGGRARGDLRPGALGREGRHAGGGDRRSSTARATATARRSSPSPAPSPAATATTATRA